MSELCKYLKLLREKKCISQKELAEELGISPASYNLYEKGKREPNIDMIEKMADYFNVSPSYLMGWGKEYHKLDFKKDDILRKLEVENLSQEEILDYTRKLKEIRYKQDNINSLEEQFYEPYFQTHYFTSDEMAKIKEYAEFIRSQRKKD